MVARGIGAPKWVVVYVNMDRLWGNICIGLLSSGTSQISLTEFIKSQTIWRNNALAVNVRVIFL